MKQVVAVFMAGASLLTATAASAQTLQWTDRGFLNLSGGVQTGSKDVSTTVSFPLYDETATITTAREVKGSPIWDVTGGIRVWKNLAVGVSVSGRKHTADGITTASIPHPIFYDQARSVTGGVADMKHEELWTGIVFGWMYPVSDKLEVMVIAGPTVAHVKHETVMTATVVEGASPTVTVSLETADKSVWGFQAGIDGRYQITSRFGAGAFIRYSKATANLTPDLKLDVGGLQIGAGLRVRF